MRAGKPAIIVLALTLMISLSLPSAAADEFKGQPTRFVILGDRTGGHLPGIFGELVGEVERLKPDFVLTVGDMIEGYVDDSTRIEGEWQEYKSLLTPLTMPVYFTAGNHDIWSGMSERFYRRHIGEPYYSFDRGGIHFIILDNSRWEPGDQLPADQLEWLTKDLKKSRKKPYTFVFHHKPFWYEGVAKNLPDTLHTLMASFGVDAVFTGHYHEYFCGKHDGIVYTGVGSSGAEANPDPTGLSYQFAWVTVDGTGFQITPIKKGCALPWDQVTAEEKMLFDRVKKFGLTMGGALPARDDLTVRKSRFSLVVDNRYCDREISDTIHWWLPDGWNVEPQIQPVRLAAGGKTTLDFTASCDSNLYPYPQAMMTFACLDKAEVVARCPLVAARQATAKRVSAPPAIDGRLSEECWQEPVSHLLSYDGSDSDIDPTSFYFCYDADNLYLAAYCNETVMDSLYDNVSDHDGAIYGEDCVGYFIEPSYGSDTSYQIYFNPRGTAFDQKLVKGRDGWMDADRSWNGEYDVKTVKGDDFWSIEARIPLAQLEASAEQGQEWRVNFRRKQRRLNSAGDWQPIDYDPQTYGVLTLR